jgi:protein-S-isoprenylcysteine O-methyltransferase Ste14
MITYQSVILVSWATFILVWILFAFRVKRDIRGGGMASVWYRYFLLRLAAAALVVFVAVRIATGTAHYTKANVALFDNGAFFTPSLLLGWIAATFVVLGVLFAIWARIHLGTNWSPAPAIKENHELVTSGPYRFVRHPIYTGILLAALGAALTGAVFGIAILLIASVMFLLRIKKEERIMLELFPDTYPAYQSRTKKLIPFIW